MRKEIYAESKFNCEGFDCVIVNQITHKAGYLYIKEEYCKIIDQRFSKLIECTIDNLGTDKYDACYDSALLIDCFGKAFIYSVAYNITPPSKDEEIYPHDWLDNLSNISNTDLNKIKQSFKNALTNSLVRKFILSSYSSLEFIGSQAHPGYYPYGGVTYCGGPYWELSDDCSSEAINALDKHCETNGYWLGFDTNHISKYDLDNNIKPDDKMPLAAVKAELVDWTCALKKSFKKRDYF